MPTICHCGKPLHYTDNEIEKDITNLVEKKGIKKMNIKDHVTSLELSKKLFEFGIKQKSFFYWEYYDDQCHAVRYFPHATVTSPDSGLNLYSAPTASELMELLPDRIIISKESPFDCFRFNLSRSFIVEKDGTMVPNFIVNYICDTFDATDMLAFLPRELFSNIWDKTLPDTLAKTLIYIKEEKLDKTPYDFYMANKII